MLAVLPERGPRISGGRERYDVGDLVDVNCTSSNSKPAAQLQWLVNDQPVRHNFFLNFIHKDSALYRLYLALDENG